MRCAVLLGLFKGLKTLFQSPDFVKQETDDFVHVDLEGRNLDFDRGDWLLWLGLLDWSDWSYDFVHTKKVFFCEGLVEG